MRRNFDLTFETLHRDRTVYRMVMQLPASRHGSRMTLSYSSRNSVVDWESSSGAPNRRRSMGSPDEACLVAIPAPQRTGGYPGLPSSRGRDNTGQ